MRRNWWKWIVVVLAVAWAIVGGVCGREAAVLRGTAVAIDSYQQCLGTPNQDARACQETFFKQSTENDKGHWLAATTVALAPILIAWAIIFSLIALVRWIGRGLQTSA
jgi:hypothetical protein